MFECVLNTSLFDLVTDQVSASKSCQSSFVFIGIRCMYNLVQGLMKLFKFPPRWIQWRILNLFLWNSFSFFVFLFGCLVVCFSVRCFETKYLFLFFFVVAVGFFKCFPCFFTENVNCQYSTKKNICYDHFSIGMVSLSSEL